MTHPPTPATTPLPCPFCGGEPKVWGEDSTWLCLCRVACQVCYANAGGYTQTRAAAIENWNRRALPVPPVATSEADSARDAKLWRWFRDRAFVGTTENNEVYLSALCGEPADVECFTDAERELFENDSPDVKDMPALCQRRRPSMPNPNPPAGTPTPNSAEWHWAAARGFDLKAPHWDDLTPELQEAVRRVVHNLTYITGAFSTKTTTEPPKVSGNESFVAGFREGREAGRQAERARLERELPHLVEARRISADLVPRQQVWQARTQAFADVRRVVEGMQGWAPNVDGRSMVTVVHGEWLPRAEVLDALERGQ